MGDLPDEVALVEIDRGDAAVRRFDQRQALHREIGAVFATAAAGFTASLRVGAVPRMKRMSDCPGFGGTRPSGEITVEEWT